MYIYISYCLSKTLCFLVSETACFSRDFTVTTDNLGFLLHFELFAMSLFLRLSSGSGCNLFDVFCVVSKSLQTFPPPLF
ncbi:hypothetical protein CARUB_v10010793mg [Capsella rubella]|uniref:Uncharacterized protein n=1 Tax=Capsella rubella TaxID=81985 RepID=R0IHN9_9BRAS|nr:hypothetical protein CARUB_v10010793mg [Capsella rubella]